MKLNQRQNETYHTMKMLLFTAAMWCIAASTLAQSNPLGDLPLVSESYLMGTDVPERQAPEEYDIEIARLPKLAVFTDSQEGFEKILKDYPMARQINVLDANGQAIYRYLPSPMTSAVEIPQWPKGVYLIELYFESEKRISSERLVIL